MLENIKLERPIAFIDVETTGVNPRSDRIVELSILRIQPDGTEGYKSHRVNPGVPIPAEATAVHGITDTDVTNEPFFHQYAKGICDFLEGCDLAGFNVIAFDLPFLEAELKRTGVDFSRKGRQMVDAMVIFHQMERRDLKAAYRKYTGKKLENAHSAKEDAKAAAEVLAGQLEMYQDLPRDVPGLCVFCAGDMTNWLDSEGKLVWSGEEAIFNFGKHSGRPLREIAEQFPDYLQWVVNHDFSPEVKQIVTDALYGDFPGK